MASSAKTAATSEMRIVIRDLKLDMIIGVHSHEKLKTQEVLVNLGAAVVEPDNWRTDDLSDWVCYEEIVNLIKNTAEQKRFKLLETFAHELVELLMRDDRILEVHLKLEKTAAVKGTRSVGVEFYKDKRN